MPRKPYGLICPISRACEILEPRWTIQILCELWNGSSRFNDIRRGVGNISPSLLSRRLTEMEAAGLVERVVDRAVGTVDYFRTAKAIELEPALNGLAEWAQRNVEADIAVREPDLSTLMWELRRLVATNELPDRRVSIRFHFSDARTRYDCYWLVARRGTVIDICTNDPGLDVDLFVETTVIAMSCLILGRTTIDREISAGRLFLSGDARLSRSMSRWLPKSAYASIPGIAMLEARPMMLTTP